MPAVAVDATGGTRQLDLERQILRHAKAGSWFVGLIGVAMLLALGSCSDSRTRIRIVGSSTVFPFTTAAVEDFIRRNPRFAAPIVEATGTGGGIKLFCDGVGPRYPDMVNASRRMKRRELQGCLDHGTGPVVEIVLGLDGVVLAQSRKAPPLSLGRGQIYEALAASPGGRPQQAKGWHDIDAALPDMPIRVLGPSPTSGTRDAFDSLYMEPGCRALAGETASESVCRRLRDDGGWVDSGDNGNLIVQKLAADPQAIGVIGFSYLARNRGAIRDVAIDGVRATPDTIADRQYPAARPLYIYVKAAHVGSVLGLPELLDELTSESIAGPGGTLARRGLVPASAATRAESRRNAMALRPLAPEALS